LFEAATDANGRLNLAYVACALRANFADDAPDGFALLSLDPEFQRELADCLRPQSSPPREYLRSEEFVRLHNAVEFGNSRGFVMNAEVTIVPSHAGIEGEVAATRFIEAFTKRFQAWCGRRGLMTAYVGVLENAPGVGLHGHFAIALPPSRLRAFSAWAERQNRGAEPPVVLSKVRERATAASQWQWFEYMAKSLTADETVAGKGDARAGMRTVNVVGLWRLRAGGSVTRKRYRIAEALAVSEQRRHAFVGAFDRGELGRDGWFSDCFIRAHEEAERRREIDRTLASL
jgi:hypothetical protein